ncbi:MAG: diphthamide biosynthesis enzyme Dph2 [Nitrosopumilaceae archaeon]
MLQMIKIDEEAIFEEIKNRKPVSVALNAPDGLLPKVQETASNIMKRFGIPAYVLADATWGSCDLNTSGAKVLGAEVLFNIGHTISMDNLGTNIVMIDAFDDISFEKIAKKSIEMLKGKTISLITDSQHLHEIESVQKILEDGGIKVKIGKGKGQLNDGQVFGCEFYPAMEIKDQVDVNVFLGQSNFHAAGIALSTNKPTYVLDPYFNEIHEVTDFAQKLQKKATLAIYQAADAKTFGIIVGLKEGQLSKLTALKFKRELEKEGKEVQLFALTDITNERLRNLKGIDAFIQVACPRISIDNHFDKPLLSTPQATALLKILRNESIDGYMQIPHWL